MIKLFENKSEVEIYNICVSEYNNDSTLKPLREYIKANSYGFCDDAHYVMWRELVKLLPDNFSFLEIGVFKGQIITLITQLSLNYNKKSSIYGVTPLSNIGDKYSVYDNIDYSKDIQNLFKTFSLEFDIDKQIINGLSTDEKIKNEIKKLQPFDLVYIDGGHDYNTVISDIELVKEIVKIGSYIVTDDSSCYKNLNGLNIFTGHKDVCDAIRDILEPDNNFIEVACVGHNRVFKKIK